MKIGFVSLGCPKNQLDTEVMLHEILQAGYEITPEDIEADVIIVNTCAFIESAKQEAIDNILDVSSNNFNSSLKEYSLYEIICRMKSLCESRIGSKQIKFELSVDNNLYSKYVGDVNNLQKILMNVPTPPLLPLATPQLSGLETLKAHPNSACRAALRVQERLPKSSKMCLKTCTKTTSRPNIPFRHL